MLEPRLARNVSVLTDDQTRVVQSPLMSLRGDTSPRGDREYVGESQLITVNIATADTPTVVAVSLDHKPTRAMPASGLKVTSGTLAHLAAICEYHGAAGSGYEWSETQTCFIGTMDGLQQQFLVI